MKIKPTYRTRAVWDEHYPEEWPLERIDVQDFERPVFSRILGPDGEPLEYDYPPIGFDLRARR